MRSRAVSLPSLCWRWMRASPPPNSLSRLRRSSSSSSVLTDIVCHPEDDISQHEVPLRRHAAHFLGELTIRGLPITNRLDQSATRFLLDGVVSSKIPFH